jgi:uroporphyrinogen decarboxylase
LLSRRLYEQFAFPYEKRVMAGLRDLGIPVFLHICGDTAHIIDLMAATGATGLEVDYQHDIAYYRQKTNDSVCLQGNIEPAGVMYHGTPEQVRNACRIALQQADPRGRLILSGGCEIPRDTPAENLHALVAAAREVGPHDSSR